MGLISGLYEMMAALGYLFGESTSNQIKRSKHPQMTVKYIREGENKRYVEEMEEGSVDRSELVTHDRLWRLEHAMELDYDSPDRENFDSDFRLNPYLRKLATPEEMQEFRDDIAYIEEIRNRIKNGPIPDGQPFCKKDWSDHAAIKWFIYVDGEEVNTQIPVLATTLPAVMENGCWKFGDKETEYKANQYSKDIWFDIPDWKTYYANGENIYPIRTLLGNAWHMVRGDDGYIWTCTQKDGEIVSYEKTVYHVVSRFTIDGDVVPAEQMGYHPSGLYEIYIPVTILKDVPPYYKIAAHGEFEECTSIKASLPAMKEKDYCDIKITYKDQWSTMEQIRYDQILAEERPKLLQSRVE